jgi:hypothetical protein
MPDEVREKPRAVVQSGKLPARHPDRTWGGPGVGAECVVCPVTKDEMEFEIQFGARRGTIQASTNSTFTSGVSRRGSSSGAGA